MPDVKPTPDPDPPPTQAMANPDETVAQVPDSPPTEEQGNPEQTRAQAHDVLSAVLANRDSTRVQEPDAPSTRALPLGGIMATSAGAPSQMTMVRAGGKLIVPGYELLESVGKGGMGIVYRAKQIALDRDIALKFLREDYHPRSGTGLRFLEEAKITAQLQHPGIPAVHEVGTLPDGRPYLAMKLIRGRTLDTMLKEQGPGSTKWLSVFEAMCQAVGFAHTHGVIHRDLKPANVMVGAFGEVQVMDWGLAKVLGRESTLPDGDDFDSPADEDVLVQSSRGSESIETRAGSYLGTPAFMAPEQATGATTQFGPRTDVFGLGAVLCTLLTGKPPYMGGNAETTRLMAAEVKQVEAYERLEACGADPDLIDLCKRCLEGDPKKRPADGAVVARQVASLRSYAEERAQQAVVDIARAEVAAAEEAKRRRVKRILGGGIAFVLLAGIVASTIFALNAEAQREEAENQKGVAETARGIADKQKGLAEAQKVIADNRRKAAEESLLISESVVNFFLNDLLRHVDANAQAESARLASTEFEAKENPTIREVLDRAALQLTEDKIDAKFTNLPIVQASVLSTIGHTYFGIGEYEKAIAHLKRAVKGYASTKGETHPLTLHTQSLLADSYRDAGHLPEAIKLYEHIHDAVMKKQTETPDEVSVLNSKMNLAIVYRMAGKSTAAGKLFEEVYEGAQRKWGPDDLRTYQVEDSMAVMYKDTGRLDRAISLFEHVLAGRTRALKPNHPETIRTMSNLAEAHRVKGEKPNIEKSIALSTDVVEASTAVLGAGHPNTLGAMNNLARALLRSVQFDTDAGKRVPSSDPRLKKAVELFEQVCGAAPAKYKADHPTRISYEAMLAEAYLKAGQARKSVDQYESVRERYLATHGLNHSDTRALLNNLAQAYLSLGEQKKASDILQQLYDLDRKDAAKGVNHPDTITAANNLAMVLLRESEDDRALALLEDASRGVARLKYEHDAALNIFGELANLYEKRKRYAEAEPCRRNFVICAKQEQGVESMQYLVGLVRYGLNLMEQKKWSEAAVPLRDCMKQLAKQQPDAWAHFYTQSLLGAAMLGDGKVKEAEPLLVSGYEGLLKNAAKLPPANASYPKAAGERLLKLYEATKQTDKAKELKAKLEAKK